MRKIITFAHLSLDGVMQGPGGEVRNYYREVRTGIKRIALRGRTQLHWLPP
jgi:hypothetical protein